jgi:hypothetical protein
MRIRLILGDARQQRGKTGFVLHRTDSREGFTLPAT